MGHYEMVSFWYESFNKSTQKKTQFCICQYHFFPKTNAKMRKQRTHYSAHKDISIFVCVPVFIGQLQSDGNLWHGYYIGMDDIEDEGKFTWLDGTPV